LRRIRELIQLSFADRRRVHVLLVHSGERAVLDYSRVRQIFTGFMVDSLPTNEAADATEPTVSTALLLGRNPRLARSRIVRGLAGMRVGLALGGGGARGLAHVGVIRVLEEEGIPIDMLAGSSFGSVVAAGYAEGRSAKRLEADMRYHWSKLGNFLLDIRDYNIPHTALLRGRKIRRMIDIAMAGAKIEECQTPVYVVCTDLVTGKEVVLDRGEMGLAVWASGSLPGIFKPVRWGEYLLVDGAVLNKVPAKVLQQKGAHVVLVVNVTPEHDREIEVKDASMLPLRSRIARYVPVLRNWVQEPNILKIISRSMTVSGIHYSRIDSDAIDVEIKPRIEHFDFLRFDQFDDIVEAGAEAARKAMPEIREVLARKH
jgi:NTE family protein